MRIAIFGSWKSYRSDQWELRGTLSEFEVACRTLGAEIAQRGHSVIIASANPNTADYHIVRGILDAGVKTEYPLIEVLVSSGTEIPFVKEAAQFPYLFSYFQAISDTWKINHLLSIKEADGVLIIGGSQASFHAGIAALVAGKRLVPVGAFGGAASQLLTFMTSLNPDKYSYLLANPYRGVLLGPWTPTQLHTTICALGLCDFPRIMIIHGRSPDWKDLNTYLKAGLSLPDPIVMGQQFGEGKTLPEKFEQLTLRVDGVIALATPDDMGTATLSGEGELLLESHWDYRERARQNVWIEVGWAWGNLSRKRILILTRGNIEIPSDLQGIELHTYAQLPNERAKEIQAFVEQLRRGKHY